MLTTLTSDAPITLRLHELTMLRNNCQTTLNEDKSGVIASMIKCQTIYFIKERLKIHHVSPQSKTAQRR
jgi:hypothetical protein